MESKLSNRLSKIRNAKLNMEKGKLDEEAKRIADYNFYMNQIKEFTPLIKEVITLGDRYNKEIGFSETYFIKGYDKEVYFMADGYYHYLGFYSPSYLKRDSIEYIGIRGGGACGNIDLLVNSNGFAMARNHNDSQHELLSLNDIPLWMLKEFCSNFKSFYNKFTSFIDNLE